MRKTTIFLALAGAALLSACVSVPTGPSVMVLPGSGKGFDQFRADDYECRAFAHNQVGGATAGDTAVQSGVTSAAVGTAVGAVAGAAIGGQRGAGVGAGTGLLVGSAAGAGAAERSSYGLQRRYDIGYVQCMYAKGHSVPSAGHHITAPPAAAPYPPPPPGAPPR